MSHRARDGLVLAAVLAGAGLLVAGVLWGVKQYHRGNPPAAGQRVLDCVCKEK